jgi:DNA-binding phage protein
MSKAKASTKLLPFDAARYLTDDAAVAEYMTAILETDDPNLLLLALGDIARARGMASLPARSRAVDTVLKVARALGIRLAAHVV